MTFSNRRWSTILVFSCACGGGSADEGDGNDTGDTQTEEQTGDPSDTGDPSESGTDDGQPKFDLGFEDLGGGPMNCKVVEDDAVGPCMQSAPPDSFEPDVQWQWEGEDGYEYTFITPLVANLTDDNDDGEIDLCDVPDVIANVYAEPSGNAPTRHYVLDGETGEPHYYLDGGGNIFVTPALGDIDGDGLPEIVGATPFEPGVGVSVIAWEHDGAKKWQSDPVAGNIGAIGLADMDNDGDVEIYGAGWMMDHEGVMVFVSGNQAQGLHSSVVAADLDGDDDQELIVGNVAFHHDGTPYYNAGVGVGYPQVADLDEDGLPEVLLMTSDGIAVLEHDGAVKYSGKRPTGDPAGSTNWRRPAAVHDMDGDDQPEFAVSSVTHYAVYEADATLVWMANIMDGSGLATGTAFDFLGAGEAQAMYGDETLLHVFDGAGAPLLQVPRTSRTAIEYPVVADVDNDGSAEIVVGSSDPINGMGEASPTVQVIRDASDRWIQARRIWNQHAYHVTNVREDGTIPELEKPSWESFNTYRTNSQIEGGGDCIPEG